MGTVAAEEKPIKEPSAKIGPGRIIMVVGPSGAGKDTLLDGARGRLAGDDRFVFPRRLVTRKSDPTSEDHEEIDRAEFDRLVGTSSVGLSWEAHGLGYVIPEEIKSDIRQGRTVIFNGSRGAIADAKSIYKNVSVIYVSVPYDVLANRLRARGRENSTEIARRMRNANSKIDDDWLCLDNDRNIESGIDKLLQAIQSLGEMNQIWPSKTR